MEEIKISVSRRGYGRDIYVLRIDGFIDTITAPELERTLSTLVDQGKYGLIIDLGGVDYISSAGWGIFISRIKEVRGNGGDLKLAKMSPGVYEVFELLEFDRILRAYDSVEEAEKGFGVEHFEEAPISSGQDSSKKEGGIEELLGGSSEESSSTEDFSREVLEGVRPGDSLGGQELSLEDKIREIVKGYPLWGSRKIRRELNTAKYGWVKLGWWRGWRVLRKLGFNSKRKRTEYAKEN